MSARFFAILLILGLSLVGATASAQQLKREITQISDNLYRFQNNFHYSIFMVTSDGVLVTDPINRQAAGWLKAEIAKRFNQPIKYLVYSHDHVDHIAGGEVFADTAVVIAHENAKRTIIGEKRPTAVPDIVFSDDLTIELGGRKVELTYVGPSHSDNMIVMRFPDERALFAVDFIPVKALAFRDMSDAYIPGWIDALKKVEGMDFDMLLPGHGPIGTKADVSAFRGYMEDLHDAVLTAARAGQSLEEMKASISLDKYKDWFRYEEWLPLNIEGMYRRVSLQRRGN